MDDDERLLIGFAPSLVAVKLPAMLAMQEPVAVDTTRAFAQTFYKQLLQYGRSVKLNLYSPP